MRRTTGNYRLVLLCSLSTCWLFSAGAVAGETPFIAPGFTFEALPSLGTNNGSPWHSRPMARCTSFRETTGALEHDRGRQ